MTLQNQPIYLSNVYFFPQLSINLLSDGQLVDDGVHFSSFGYVVQDRRTRKVIRLESLLASSTRTESKHGWQLLLDVRLESLLASSTGITNNLWTTWYRRLGLFNNDRLTYLFRHGCLDSSINKSLLSTFMKSKCLSCCLSKSHASPFLIHYSRATTPFELIHTDVKCIAPKWVD